MKQASLLVLILTFTLTFVHGQTAKSKNWISVSYVECLKNKLPCECQRKEKYSLIWLDSNYVTIYDGIIYDPNGWELKKIDDKAFQVYHSEYITGLFRDSIKIIGTLQIVGDSLYYIDQIKNKTVFINFGTTTDDQFAYDKEHISLLNSAFLKRGYPILEKILKTDSLSCNCNPELGFINLISAGRNGWILEQSEDSLFIYKWINFPNEKVEGLKIEKRLLKAYKW